MLSLDEAIAAVAEKLAVPPPPPDADGDALFQLADGMRLGLREQPGDGVIAWAGVAAAAADEAEAEKTAADFLRFRLARLRRASRVAATRSERGELLLSLTIRPASDRDLLEQVAALLNETEAMRRVMAGGAAAPAPGGSSLFAGMSAFFDRP